MSFGVLGQKCSGRPSSAKPHNNINPITGEDVTLYTSRHQSDISRPEVVPSLNLGDLSDRDGRRRPIGKDCTNLYTPATASTVRGAEQVTSRSSVYSVYSDRPSARQASHRPDSVPKLAINNKHNKSTEYKPAVADKVPVPDDRTVVGDHQKQQYKQPKAEQQDIDDDIDRLNVKNTSLEDADNLIFVLSQISKPSEPEPMDPNVNKRLDAETMKEEKRKQELVETVMVDQLSRPPISDTEQDTCRPISRSHEPGMPRGLIRTLHESKIKTSGSATENLLSKRVRFGARILTRNGHDAIKELMGFFFMLDNTFTIYEYRQFGKSAKALPFLVRRVHEHCGGRLRGQTVTLSDIYPGAAIVVGTGGQTPLPASVTHRQTVTFIITDVDQQAKEQQLLAGTRGSELSQKRQALNFPNNAQQLKDYTMLHNLQVAVREKLRKRGSRAISSIGAFFRSMDTNADGTLDFHEFKQAIKSCRIPIADEQVDLAWSLLDLNGDGRIEYPELIRGVLGTMSECRKSLVLKAFRKIDSKKSGTITHTDIRKFFCGSKTSSAAMETDGTELKSLLQSFAFCAVAGEVTYEEFEEYYEGISLIIDNDQDFICLLRKTWGI